MRIQILISAYARSLQLSRNVKYAKLSMLYKYMQIYYGASWEKYIYDVKSL